MGRRPPVESVGRRVGRVGEQLRRVRLRVDGVPSAGAGEAAEDGGGFVRPPGEA